MRSQIAGVVVCVLLTLTATRATAQPSSETTTVSQRYSAWMNAFHARDGATMDRKEAPSLMLIFDGEIWTKDRPRVEALKGRAPLATSFTLEQVVTRVAGNVAILTGIENDTDTNTGATKMRAAFTSVWKREGGEWKVWSAHWSEIPKATK
jgi:ketosteroid isomerase-like protein